MITVVKIGGEVVDNPEVLPLFIEKFAAIEGPKLLVHGGGKEATRLSARMEIPTVMIEGRRVTSRETLDVVTMVYAGLVNKRIVSMLQATGCNALGMCGADGDVLRATRRPAEPVDYGFVGDVSVGGVNAALLSSLTAQGIVPVLCAITHDGHGTLLNTNADSVASIVARGMAQTGPTRLVYCFEQPGVMADIADPLSLIRTVSRSDFDSLKEQGIVSKGMIPKLKNAFDALAGGVEQVEIKHALNLDNTTGTAITL